MRVLPLRFRNRLLSAFARDDLEQFFSDLHPESFPPHQTIYSEGGLIEHVYFVEEGLASVLKGMENGFTIEVGMVGIEGMVGMPALLGAETSADQVIIQMPATLLRMDAAQCKLAFEQSAAMRTIVHRFTLSFINQSAQTAACNRLHSVEHRCARWLLMSSDRVQSDVMPMTHEFLSIMLGVRRAGVSEVAEELQRSGTIQYHRGELRIVDREALEATACECYQLDRARFERLLLRP